MVTRLRIGRLVLPATARGDAAATEAALRAELARLAPAALAAMTDAVAAPNVATDPLRAATPAGRGREAAGRILGSIGAGVRR